MSDDRLFWRTRLKDLPPLRLPTDRAPTPERTFSPATHRHRVPAELADGLRRLAEQHATTPLAVLAAGCQALFARYSGGTDVAVGVVRPPTATMLIRAEVAGTRPFGDLVAAVRDALREADGHGAIPLSELSTELYEEADPFLSLVRVTVAAQAGPEQPVDLALTWTAGELSACYNTHLFDPATVERLTGHLLALLREALAGPDRPLADLALLSEDERSAILSLGHGVDHAYPAERSVHDLVAEIALRTPDEPAVVAPDGVLSYAELDERANELAHRLVAAGVRAEARVGLLLSRSSSAVVAMLAVLKAGGVYVPLHDSYPDDRIRWVLADVGAVALLTDQAMRDRAEIAGPPVILVDDPGGPRRRSDAPRGAVEPQQLAYVMHTSGSTGTPKGVAVTHRNIVALAWDRDMRAEASQRTLFNSPHAFDAATYEIWVPLLMGGRVVVAPPDLTPEGLEALTAEHGVTAAFLTAALFRLFAGERPGCFAALREVWTGGEAPSPAAMEQVLLTCPETALYHVYGPTETTTFASRHRMTLHDVSTRSTIIGTAMDNTRTYVLDQRLRPVPIGVPGELYLAGAGTARGYVGRPGLTAERFVADPFSVGGTLYRTGDVVQWTADGVIQYLGRTDDQVKIRGFRVELGEIESALRRHPGVTDAVVTVWTGEQTRSLIAYPTGPVETTEAQLREFLAERLPGYMVPARILWMARLPMTANGKVDRRALPVPDDAASPEAPYVAPRTETERVFAGIWAEVLGVERIGITDNFFSLGGDSILTMKVVSRARARGLAVSAKDVFAHPTVAELAGVVQPAPVTQSVPPSEPEPESGAEPDGGTDDRYPLTPMQSGMLFDALMLDDPGLHLIQFTLRLDGIDDPEALEDAWRQAARRHDVLRTALRWADVEEPMQVVHSDVVLPVVHLDWRSTPESEHPARLRQLLAKDRTAGIDLTQAPLSRVTIVRLGPATIELVWSMHHLLIDGWSAAELLRDVLDDYRGAPAASPRRPFREYVRWLIRQDHTLADAYWQRRMAGFTSPTTLPGDRQPGEGYRPSATESVQVAVAPEAASQIIRYAQRTGLTVNTLVQGAWAVLLSRSSGERDVCFGTTMSVRPAELDGAESMVGMLINTQPVRVDVDDDGETLPWLHALQREQAAAREFGAAPLPRVRSFADLPPGVSLFDNVLVFQNYPFDRSGAPDGPTIREFDVGFATNYPLGLSVFPDETLAMRLLYDPKIFDRATVERLSAQLLTVLESLLDGAALALGEVEVLPTAERRRILEEWCGAPAGYSIERRIHQVISERARQSPDRIAVVCGERQLTYAELEERANQLAHHLVGLGVTANVLVGVAVERGLDLVVGILGVLKAGGAYVPLDPDYPAQRIATIVQESRPAVVLTHKRHLGTFAEVSVPTVLLDSDWPAVATQPRTAPADHGSSRDLVYVVYTSGSTGRPKGVMVEHRSLFNTVQAVSDLWLTRDSRVFQLCPMSFDAASLDLFSTLAAGATLVAPVTVPGYGGAHLIEQLRSANVTAVTMPPTVLPALDSASLPGLEFIRVGGEVLTPDLAEVWSVGHRLVNNYGPSEGAIAATLFPVPPGSRYDNVPIGTPIANDRLYVLDSRFRPVPVGVTGELYIGGDGVARGYVGRPGLTAERFVADPFGPPGARLYRTGDLVRWTASGHLSFAGRSDDQVKIRGFRVEPREVENVLLRHDAVAEAAVVVHADEAGGKRLIAYLVPRAGADEPAGDALRKLVAQFVPEYMVPAAFVVMAALPLNRNGKLDRAALPVPGPQQNIETAYLAARNPTEAALCRIWSEVLGVARVGVHDRFFDLGGDSISSIRLVARIRAAFGVRFSPQDLFDRPRVAELADVVQERIFASLATASGAETPDRI